VLSNDNVVGDGSLYMEVGEEVTMTPTTYVAVTPAASLKPPAQSASDGSASHRTKTTRMDNMAVKCETSKNDEMLEESKQLPNTSLAATPTASQTPDADS
jgi:hypothetical protein